VEEIEMKTRAEEGGGDDVDAKLWEEEEAEREGGSGSGRESRNRLKTARLELEFSSGAPLCCSGSAASST
jgi:hypothetical protein